MLDLIPINIAIADRTYRLKIKPEDEEVVRKTVKLI
ncbi:MAG: cell division protein ZapA, partial [Deinococcales bacterium]|nr:cell division protein ZapA [Chitinophagaceae bacterium]